MRRQLTTVLLCAILAACSSAAGIPAPSEDGPERLTARPLQNVTTIAPGLYGLLVAVPKDASLFLPTSIPVDAPVPLVVMLHGAGGTPATIDTVYAYAQRMGFAVLVPRSREATWDLARGQFGADVPIIDKALEQTFRKVRVDVSRIALAGFSDGASYGLSLGIANADLFTHIIAFSPGFIRAVSARGKASFFITHGTADPILPVDNTARYIVPYLRGRGYSVRYEEFQGGHRIDPVSGQAAFDWLIGGS